MRRLLATLLIIGIGGATGAQPPLRDETLLPVHDGRDAYAPAAAFGGGGWLIVWQSGRMAPGDMTRGLTPLADLVAMRADRNGNVLDEAPFSVSVAQDLREQPRVAFGNGLFLVVWQDLRNEKDWDVYAARVTPAGKVLDPDGILVVGGPRNQALPRVTWDGQSFWVVWQDFRSGSHYEVYGGRVSPEGKPLDGQGVLLDSGVKANRQCYAPATAAAGDGRSFNLWVLKADSVVAYKTPGSRGIFVGNGRPESESPMDYKVDARQHGPGGNAHPLALAAAPDAFLAAWRTDYTAGRGGGPGGSTAALFDRAGTRTANLYLAGNSHRIDWPALCWDGTAFVAAWQENGATERGQPPFDAVRASRVSVAGAVLGEAVHVSGTFESPARAATVASDGAGTTLIAYEKHPETGAEPIRIGFRHWRTGSLRDE